MIVVQKPDGKMRFCVDYRQPIDVTVRDAYPLPRMDDCIDFLGDAKVFYDARLQLGVMADSRGGRGP